MRIGIDARTILNPEKGDGIGEGHYTYQLLRHILQVDTKNEYTLFFDARVRQKDIAKFDKPNVRIRFYPFSDYKKFLPVAYSEILGRATLAREKLDLVHSTSPMSRVPMAYTGKSVVTFHNMGMFACSDCYPYSTRSKATAVARYMAKKASHIIASSQSIAQSAQREFRISSHKITVVYGGVDGRFFGDNPVPLEDVKKRLGISSPYMLFLGTLSPINNIVRLLEAFAKFRESCSALEGRECPYTLVIAGKRGWLAPEHTQVAKDLGIGKWVVFTGYIVGDDLVPLFRGAEFFVLPSLYEGFGSTVLEAFACGVPAIVSRVGSMPEVAEDSARFVDPVNSDDIASAMLEFAKMPELRAEYARKGSERVKAFNWEKTARETIEVYKQVIEGNA